MSSITQHLICPLCNRVLLGGYFLTCQHCFCLTCIKSFVDSSDHWDYNRCPICRKKFPITELDFDGDYSHSIIDKIVCDTHHSGLLEQRKREIIISDYLSKIRDEAITQKISMDREDLMDIPMSGDPMESHNMDKKLDWSEILLFIAVFVSSMISGMRYGERSDKAWRVSGYGIGARKIIGDICAFVLWLAVIIFCFYNVNFSIRWNES